MNVTDLAGVVFRNVFITSSLAGHQMMEFRKEKAAPPGSGFVEAL
jgi:hypothetical protein